jgi:predicted nucleic acid-binding protein
MRKYLLDTGIVRRIGIDEHVTKRFAALDKTRDKVYLSVLTIHEMHYGLSNAKGTEYETKARKAIEFVNNKFRKSILPITEETAELFGKIKGDYKEKTGINPENIKKHTVDFMLVATAINESAILVSQDDIFRRIQEFRTDFEWENWTKL